MHALHCPSHVPGTFAIVYGKMIGYLELSRALVTLSFAVCFLQEKVAATMASATNKVQYVIGLMIGIQSVIKLAPFALAILSGIHKGFDKVRILPLRPPLPPMGQLNDLCVSGSIQA